MLSGQQQLHIPTLHISRVKNVSGAETASAIRNTEAGIHTRPDAGTIIMRRQHPCSGSSSIGPEEELLLDGERFLLAIFYFYSSQFTKIRHNSSSLGSCRKCRGVFLAKSGSCFHRVVLAPFDK
jgi:hypothetical protein